MRQIVTRVFICILPEGEEFCALTSNDKLIRGPHAHDVAHEIRMLTPLYGMQSILYEVPRDVSASSVRGSSCLAWRNPDAAERQHFDAALKAPTAYLHEALHRST